MCLIANKWIYYFKNLVIEVNKNCWNQNKIVNDRCINKQHHDIKNMNLLPV